MALSREQVAELERAILARRDSLLAEIREEVSRARDESFGELAGPVTDPGDDAVADLLSDLDQAEVTRDLQEVRELEAARKRIADGRFGLCVDCGLDIPLERLRVVPEAMRCIQCQQVREKTFSHPPEPRI